MSVSIGVATNPATGQQKQVWAGFSWPCLIFGCFWYASKNMWLWGILALITAIFSGGLSWLVFPFFANRQHINFLRANGYSLDGSASQSVAAQTKQVASLFPDPQAPAAADKSSQNIAQESRIADELIKLAELRDRGVITHEEFERQKAKLI